MWTSFGLQAPGSITTPGQPVNLAAHRDATGAIVVQCDAVPLATRYRFRTLLVGLQPDYVLAASSKEPLATIPAILPGQSVQIIVQAVNVSLQGVASDPIQFTVLIPAAKAVEAKPALVIETAELSNGNGHANGVHARH